MPAGLSTVRPLAGALCAKMATLRSLLVMLVVRSVHGSVVPNRRSAPTACN